MNPLQTLISWGKSALSAITGGVSDVAGALLKTWNYITNVHNLVGWLLGGPQLKFILEALYNMSALHGAQLAVVDALRRLSGWLWLTMVGPWVRYLQSQIAQLHALLLWWVAALKREIVALYFASLAYTRQQVGIERAARIKAVQAEHAAMLARVAWALATVQHQAAAGYNAGTKQRLNTVESLLKTLADRQPEVKALTSTLIKSVLDLETIDNPLLRFGIAKLLNELIGKLGVDKVTGDLISRLLGPWTEGGRPNDLTGVEKDVATRLSALEGQWADFMAAGGPEVEQAGTEWRDMTSVAVDAVVLGVFTLAVTDPQAFATGVNDTIGATGNTALDAIIKAIHVR